MVQSAAEVAAMLGLAEDDPVVVEALEAQAIRDKEERAKLRVARTLGDHLESGAKDPFANTEAGYAPRGDAARRLGRTTPEPKPEHLGKAPKKPAPQKKPAAKKKKKKRDDDDAAKPKKKTKKREAPPPSEDESEDDAGAAPPARKSAASATSSASAALPPTGGDSSSDDEEPEAPPPPPKPAPKAKRRPKKPRQSEAEECADDGWKNFAHELLPKMNLTALKKMLATLKPLAKDAYKAAMAAREGKDAAAAQKVVRALFEHIPRDAILDAYAGATRKFQLPN
jgi:hypothetical protein